MREYQCWSCPRCGALNTRVELRCVNAHCQAKHGRTPQPVDAYPVAPKQPVRKPLPKRSRRDRIHTRAMRLARTLKASAAQKQASSRDTDPGASASEGR